MKRRITPALRTMALLCLSVALCGSALAQDKPLKEQLTGTWTNVANSIVAPDGSKRASFGPNPKGILIFSPNGQYAQIIVSSEIPKFKVNNRLEGTPEEYKAAVHGTVAHFGTWSVDEASKTLTRRVEGNMFPNQTDAKNTIALAGDDLTLSNPAGSTGGKVENVWKRAR